MRRLLFLVLRICALPLLLTFQTMVLAAEALDWAALLAQGAALREQGHLYKSIDLLSTLSQTAGSPQLQATALGELGASQLQAHRYAQAESSLRQAFTAAPEFERARPAFYLGNLAIIRKRNEEARYYYQEALRLNGDNADFRLGITLNLARIAAAPEKLSQLSALSAELARLPANSQIARFHLNLGEQARRLGSDGVALAFSHINEAHLLAQQLGEFRLQLEALDALGQLYEDRERSADAIALTRLALDLAHKLEPDGVADLLINLEWRLGRLLRATGHERQALAAYLRAVSQIERVRQDMPIEDQEGRSTFQLTLEPVLLGYADLQLQLLDAQTPELQALHLRQTLNAIELIRQSEMQDFLGDRCAVEDIEDVSSRLIAAGTAILYPVIFEDRVELLLATANGIVRTTTPISGSKLRSEAAWLADSLRNGYSDYEMPARKLYDWLLRPIADLLAARQVKLLVVVPDGVLRLVPLAALYDGKEFAIEKYAVSMVTGLSMTNTATSAGREASSLVVGMAEPGPVVDKLNQTTISQILGASSRRSASSRSLAQHPAMSSARLRSPTSPPLSIEGTKRSTSEMLHEALLLPGVKQEVEALSRILGGTSMLDSRFTLDHFRKEATAGEYRIIHIASHGVFGGNAESSYIMAFDDVLTLDGLQSLLKTEELRRTPIELLTLSACETADGDARSPLGISGAAIKARARSVLGTLWPVDDTAARKVMESFYRGLRTAYWSKAEALRQAQLELVHSKDLRQPFFWAPFVLIGNWL
ncbi:MAG: CHAT domain-containing protein [Azonexus sp.]